MLKKKLIHSILVLWLIVVFSTYFFNMMIFSNRWGKILMFIQNFEM